MWLIPVLFLGALVMAATRRSPREGYTASRPLALPMPMPVPMPVPMGSAPPSPLAVLIEYVRAGQQPPPPVVLCAIAEAEAIGRDDVAADIIRLFVQPVVQAQQSAEAAQAAATYGAYRQPPPIVGRAMPARPSVATPISENPMSMPPPTRPTSLPQAVPLALDARKSDAELLAMINADPAGFMALLTREVMRRPVPAVIDVPSEPTRARQQPPQPPQPQPQPPVEQPVQSRMPPEQVAQMQELAGMPEVAEQTRALAPGSPIQNVSDEGWRQFVMRLSRESPTFSSSRHVGQFRQRRERIEELGIDPRTLYGSAPAQRAALDADMADAYQHAVGGELVASYVGQPIVTPSQPEPVIVTLSGLLGVIQCAGIDGGTSWFERPGDRKRFPNTTQVFLQVNGVF